MKISILRTACNNGRTCPNINSTDRGTLVVQGYVVSAAVAAEVAPEPGLVVVEIPHALLPELTMSTVGLRLTDRATVLVAGQRVTDSDVLSELKLPAGEDAVEIAADLLDKVAADAR